MRVLRPPSYQIPPSHCTHSSAYNFGGFPVVQDLTAVFPTSPMPSPFRRKGSPRVDRMGNGRCPVKGGLGSEEGDKDLAHTSHES